MSAGEVWLRKGRERAILRRHPWIFSGSVARVEGEPADGDIVEVRDAAGEWLARGYLNRQSQIQVRLLTWDQSEPVDGEFWRRRVEHAIAGRAALAAAPDTNAYRLIHAESDGLPGLIVDRYGDFLVVQFLALGVDRQREVIVSALDAFLSPRGIHERSDVDVRQKEGLEERSGTLLGQEPPQRVDFMENGCHFQGDLRSGQKTGFYLDQRENRARLPSFCSGADVLDGFSYTGAFAVYAAQGGAARVTLVDSSAPALALARVNLALSGHDPEAHEFVEGSVFDVLREYRDQGRDFDVIVLDPPSFAPTPRLAERAARAYKDINLLAFKLLRPGGVLFSTSCSGGVSAELFQKILFGAALDAGRDAQIIGYLRQGADHPVALTFPEGAYLKGLICRVW